jgi:hypothetical protein
MPTSELVEVAAGRAVMAMKVADSMVSTHGICHAAYIFVAVTVPEGKMPHSIVEKDEHPRATMLETPFKLPTPFRKGGTVTQRRRHRTRPSTRHPAEPDWHSQSRSNSASARRSARCARCASAFAKASP